MAKLKLKLHTPIYDLSSKAYHGVKGTYSSSQLKDLLDDPDLFRKKYIEKSIPRKESDAFDLGTFVHSGVLEPHNLEKDCAVFPGKIRSGAKWETFKQANKDKAIILSSQWDLCKDLTAKVRSSDTAMGYINEGKAEVSMFVKVLIVWDHDYINCGVFAPKGKLILTPVGFIPYDHTSRSQFQTFESATANAVPIILKVRADMLGSDFVYDLKTTKDNACSKKEMESAISNYEYDLSAALYVDMFSVGTGSLYDKFIWTFVSKTFRNCKTWEATTTQLAVGRAKYHRALISLAKGIKTNWVEDDELGELDPQSHQLNELREFERVCNNAGI